MTDDDNRIAEDLAAAATELDDAATAWADAIVSNDTARIAEFIADEWVIVSDTGITERADFLSLVESGDLTHSAMARTSEPRIRIHGDTAIFTARVTNTAHYRGEQFNADEWTTDVFVRDGGRWRCVHSHITGVRERRPPPAGDGNGSR